LLTTTTGAWSRLFILRDEETSILWRDSEDVEEVGVCLRQVDSFGVI
jgi:hypothetical protein